jgi:5-formyltetrahydrofolate cyclo-ligase
MPDRMSIDRDALRSELRQRRHVIPAAARIAAAEQLAERVLALPFAPATGHVAGYWAMDGEIALHAWQLRLPSTVTYCLPVLGPGGCLRFAPWRPGDTLASNRFGIPEPDVAEESLLVPASMALVLVPLVGFDARGHRLGMGGGWYDRSFAFRNRQADNPQSPPPWLVGAAFAAQRLDMLAAEPWDVALDAVCSERDTIFPEATTIDDNA